MRQTTKRGYSITAVCRSQQSRKKQLPTSQHNFSLVCAMLDQHSKKFTLTEILNLKLYKNLVLFQKEREQYSLITYMALLKKACAQVIYLSTPISPSLLNLIYR